MEFSKVNLNSNIKEHLSFLELAEVRYIHSAQEYAADSYKYGLRIWFNPKNNLVDIWAKKGFKLIPKIKLEDKQDWVDLSTKIRKALLLKILKS